MAFSKLVQIEPTLSLTWWLGYKQVFQPYPKAESSQHLTSKKAVKPSEPAQAKVISKPTVLIVTTEILISTPVINSRH